MLYTVIVLALIGLCIYIFFAFGLPKIVSLYVSGKFKANVNIATIDLIRRELKNIRFAKGKKLDLFVQNVKLTTNFFSDSCSSLLTLKISGVEAKILKSTEESINGEEDGPNVLQKVVSSLAFVKFLVTFTLENVHVCVVDSQITTMSISKADFYTESIRSGFLNLVADIDSANVQGPQLAFGSTQNTRLMATFCLSSNKYPVLEQLEASANYVKSNVPLPLLKQTKRKSSSSSSLILPTFPNIAFNVAEFEVTVSYEKLSWSTSMSNVKINHNKTDNKSEMTTDEIYISDDKGTVFIQQFKLNRRNTDGILATYSHISIQSCVDSMDCICELRERMLDVYQPFKRRSFIEDTNLSIEISGGTIESTKYNLAFHTQQITSKIGLLENNKAGNNFYLDNFHFDFDKERNELSGTVANIGMALCEDSLLIVFEWCSSILSLSNPTPKSSPNSKFSLIKWGLRSQSIQVDFTLPNDLSCQLFVESTKSKGQGPLKGIGCKGLSLVLKEPSLKDGINIFQIEDLSITQDSSVKEVLIKFPNKLIFFWSALSHRILFDTFSVFRNIWLESMLRMITKSRKSSKKGVATTRLYLPKGFEIKAKLQRHALDIKISCLDFRKVGDEWKFQIPDFVMDVADECECLFKLEGFSGQKSMSNPVADKYRLDIDGVVDKDNTSVVLSMALLQFNFPHQMDVYDVLSNDLMAIVKWLRILHTRTATNFDVVHPDILIFIKQVDIEFQDDPFEVSLRDNFELLEDEHFESFKRFECLQNKIEELKKTHPMLQSSKIEELFGQLKKKNADIYVQRAMKLKQTMTKRTRLLSFNLASMEFFIFSDRSMTGYETAVDFIQEIDHDSPCSEDLEFVSAYHKWVRFECKSASTFLRDYPQTLTDAKHILFWGKIALAEEAPADRAIRTQIIDQGRPYYQDFIIERSLLSFKLYHDLALDMDFASFAHGPCWEPTLSHFSVAMAYVTGRSKDPSPPLAWWDKLRLRLHGRLLMSVKTLKLQMHTTLDPYNTTEEVELTFADANFDWTNCQFKVMADELNLYVRTASKYDDCQLLHVPSVVLTIKLDWICLGNPDDHHSLMPCAPEKLPEYSHNVQHDSYRAFRSQNVNVRLSIETRKRGGLSGRPRLEMFSSTIRWMESLKWLFSGSSRPIRRGKIFHTTLPPRKSFFRHFKKFQLSVSLHQLQLDYWTSASMTKGVQVNVAHGVSLSSEYSLKLVHNNFDGLIHRPRSDWTIEYTNCQVGTSDIWFQSMTSSSPDSELDNSEEENSERASGVTAIIDPEQPQAQRHIEKSFFFSVEDVQYNRDVSPMIQFTSSTERQSSSPTHILTVNGAKGAWTQSNRDMAFSLYDSWRRAHILREQVSSEGLKSMINFKKSAENETTPSPTSTSPTPPSSASLRDLQPTGELSLSTFMGNSPKDPLSSQKSVPIVYSEDKSNDTKKNDMEAMAACTKDDVLFRNWLIRFINSQMLMKGCETQGHLILSAAKTELLSQMHMPVWKDQTLMSKSSWSGSLESMQYFATVIPEDSTDHVNEDTILWLTKDKIEDNEKIITEDDLPEIVGSGQSVGGVISAQAGPQLQRIVSRCKCEFYYVAYGENSLEGVTDRIPKRPEVNPWSTGDKDNFVNAFSLIHHDLDVCTNSLQYNMILDVLNNLLLYIEPSFRSRAENYMRLKYQLMLSNLEDQRKPIVQLHAHIRQTVCQLRAKEKAIFAIQNDDRISSNGLAQLDRLEKEVQKLKEAVNSQSEELDIRQRCLKEFQMMATEKRIRGNHVEDATRHEQLRRKNEIFFSRAHWKLTETDGQLGIADAIITNFFYTKSVMHDDSAEHLFEIGYLNVKNCIPGQVYTEVIYPTELSKDVPLDRQRTLRVFCREKSPVGGISVKAHFEINLVPLTIGITQAFYKRIMAFCFPEKISDLTNEEHENSKDKKGKKHANKDKRLSKKSANFYVESPLNQDDVEEMKVRAQQNKLFVYIKIPEVPICVSYKGEKEKNKILDVANFRLQVPTIEYHNMTWTWLDLLLAVKSRIKDSLLSQAIKQKLSLKHRVDNVRPSSALVAGSSASSTSDIQTASNADDEEKAKLLLGTRHIVAKVTNKK